MTPSLEGWSTKAKEAPSPHEVRLALLDTNPVFQSLGDSDLVNNEILKKTKFNTLKTKVNNFENKIPDAATLIYTNQYNRDKQNVGKKLEIMIKKNTRYEWFSDYNCFEYKNL